MPAGKLDTQKYNAMVNNASGGVVISSQIFKDFIADVKDKIDSNYDEVASGTGNYAKYIFGSNERGATGWTMGVNNIQKSGFYYISSDRSNLPIVADGYLLQMTDANTASFTAGLQIFIPWASDRMFFRRYMGSWQPWQEIMTVIKGAGSPEGVVTAPVGTIYINTNGGATTTLYVKTSGTGNTGWTAK